MDENRCNIFLPDIIAKWCRERIRENKVPLSSAFIIGLLCYMYAFTNKLMNHDEVQSLFSKGGTVTSGRWGLGGLDSIFPNYSMPWIYGIIAIALMAVAVCLILRIVSVRNPVLQSLAAGTIIAFPSLIGTFSYMFTSSPFALSFLLAVLAVWFAKKDKRLFWIPALGSMVLSLSIYQSYISVAAGLLVILLIRQLLEGEDVLPVIFRGIRFVLFLAASLGLYYGATQLILIVKGVSFNSYASGNIGFSLAGIPAAIATAYQSFFRFFSEGFQGLMPSPLSRLLHGLCLMVALVLLLTASKKEPGRILLLLALVAVLPLAINCMYLFTTAESIHTLVLYGFIVVYALCAVAADVCLPLASGGKALNLCRQAALNLLPLAMAVILVSNVYLANMTWLNLQLRYENAYSFYTSLMGQIQSMPEFTEDSRLAIIGDYQDPEFYEDHFDFTEKIAVVKGFKPDSYSKGKFLEYYLGVSLPFVSEAELQTLAASPEVLEMAVYPYYGSVKVIGDTIVVKLS